MSNQAPYRTAFVLEQTLGHVTHAMNLRHFADQDTRIDPVWLEVPFTKRDLWERMPGVSRNWSLRGSLRARHSLEEALQKTPLSALFVHTQTVALFSLRRLRQIPSLLSLDATPCNIDRLGAGYGHKPAVDNRLNRAKFAWNRASFRAARHLVAWSRWAAESLQTDYGIESAKISVVPPGINLTLWKPTTQVSPPGEKLRLLFVGGDFDRKGGSTLLTAFREGLNRDCVLDIVTPEGGETTGIAGTSGVRVHPDLTANSAALRALTARADIFVLPTRADCLPLAVLEAMACGLPVITTSVGALSEAVIANTNGLLIPPDDPRALTAAVRVLCSDAPRRRAMGNASRRIAETRFDACENYGTILAMVKQLAAGTR